VLIFGLTPLGLSFAFIEFFFVLLTNATLTHPTENQKETDMKMNNCPNNFSGSSVYELWSNEMTV